MASDVKTCTKCGTAKSLIDFALKHDSRDGYSTQCKLCKREYMSSYSKTNEGRTKRNAYAKLFRLVPENLDKKRAAGRAYNKSAAGKAARCRKESATDYKMKERARSAKRYASDPASYIVKGRRRAMIVKHQRPRWANRSAMLAVYREARALRDSGINVHVDHVIPLRGALACGLHCEQNLEIKTAHANLLKGNSLNV